MEFLDYRDYFEWQVDILGNTVSHNLKKAVWRYESNGPIAIKPPQSDTLMKLNIVDLNAFLLLLTLKSLLVIIFAFFHEELVIDAELALGHP